jgi:hypothetical protein
LLGVLREGRLRAMNKTAWEGEAMGGERVSQQKESASRREVREALFPYPLGARQKRTRRER